MAKFKKGDAVRIVRRMKDNDTGQPPECYEKDGFVGKEGFISDIANGSYTVYNKKEARGHYYGIFKSEELELLEAPCTKADYPLPTDVPFHGFDDFMLPHFHSTIAQFSAQEYMKRIHGEFFRTSLFELPNYINTKTPTLMTSIKNTLRRITRTEPTKTFIAVGFMDENEEVTSKGLEALQTVLWDANVTALKDMADVLLADQQESK